MRAKTMLIAAALAASVGSPSQAAEDELALAREFLVFHALFEGSRAPREDELDTAAPNLVTYCAMTPAAQMPRIRLEACKGFDSWKAIIARDKLRRAFDR